MLTQEINGYLVFALPTKATTRKRFRLVLQIYNYPYPLQEYYICNVLNI